MDVIQKYFSDGQELNGPTSDEELVGLEKRLGTRLPDDYKDFLKIINGFEGTIGQSYVRLNNVSDIEEYTRDYCSEFYPDHICIGTNGAGELFVIGKTDRKQMYGVLPTIGDMNDYLKLGDTLDNFLGRLYNGIFLE